MATSNIKLSQEWKQAFEQGDYQSFSQKVSLYDLLFSKKSGDSYILRAAFGKSENQFAGFKLKHNIIAVDTTYTTKVDDIYTFNKISEDSENYVQSKKAMIEVALPSFDLRAKPIFLTDENKDTFLEDDIASSQFSKALQSFAPLKLLSSDYFYSQQAKSGLDYAPGIKVYSEEAVQNFLYANSFSTSLKFAIDSEIKEKAIEDPSSIDIVLCDEDKIFENKFLQDYPNLRAFSSMAVSIKSSFWQKLFFSYYSFEKTDSALFVLNADSLSVALKNQALVEYLLKNCYILVKCPFFADYVDYKDFGQELSKTADVVHRNLMVSASGDWERFDPAKDDYKDTAPASRPYLPYTIPSIDRFASEVLDGATLEDVIESSKSESSNIGYLQTETFETAMSSQRSSTSLKDGSTLAPLWFDPDSRAEASDYNDTPTFMPKNGNLYVDGRIISRSIDELWEAIKRLESGRDSDTKASSKADIGYPMSESEEKTTSSDTRPALKKIKFIDKYGDTKIGDPTYVTYSTSAALTFTVQEWVNDPEKIKYNLMSELKSLYGWDYSVEDSLITVSKALEATGALEEYAPASSPYTLRELEALLRGLQYNLAYLTVYSSKHFVRAGKLGAVKNTGKFNEAAGTAYQLHRDFLNNGTDTQYDSYKSLGALDETTYGSSQDDVPSKSVFMSANGTWQSVYQFMNVRVRDDEEF